MCSRQHDLNLNMYKKIFLKTILFSGLILGSILSVSSQVPVTTSQNKVVIEGKVYFLHVVKPGQTLYSISRAYLVPEADVIRENPGSDAGLQIGQVLKIPVSDVKEILPAETTVTPEGENLSHTVSAGETVFSIAKKYGLTIEDVEKSNPSIVNNQISVGQVLLIPRKKTTVQTIDFITHKVRRKETIYGIARMHSISEETLKEYNPELDRKLPRPGQTLRIPVIHKQEQAAIIIPVQEKLDTIIPGFKVLAYDTLKIAGNYSYYLDSLPEIDRRSLNIAYLLPFSYKPFVPAPPDVEKPKDKDNRTNPVPEENPNDQMLSSRNFLEFLEGSLLAIDSLKNVGVDVNVYIYDTHKSPEITRAIINSSDFRKMDLIIGPFYSYNVEIVSEYAKRNHIPLISPLSGDDNLVASNPFMFQLNPGYKAEFDRMADYVSRFHDKNIVLLHGADSSQLQQYAFLKNEMSIRLASATSPDTQRVTELVYDYNKKENLIHELQKVLSRDKENLLVIPETSEAFVTTVVTQLYFQLKNYRIEVVGMPHWNAFQNIDFIYFHKLALTFFTPYYFSYDSANIKHFLKDYRNTYYSEPVTLTKKGGVYAFLGYDISFNFIKLMDKYDKKFILHLNDPVSHELMNDFHFVPLGAEGGFENRSLVLVKFFENLDIMAEPYEIAVPAEPDTAGAVQTGAPSDQTPVLFVP